MDLTKINILTIEVPTLALAIRSDHDRRRQDLPSLERMSLVTALSFARALKEAHRLGVVRGQVLRP